MLHTVSKYYGGVNLAGALKRVKDYNKRGLPMCLAFSPVTQHHIRGIARHQEEYLKALKAISQQRLDCQFTLKLNQFGIYHSPELALASVEPIVRRANDLANFVWIDMELPESVNDTLAVYHSLAAKYPLMGICLQSCLKRTQQDLDRLLKTGAIVRLVKGFYKANDFASWQEVGENFRHLQRQLLLRGRQPALGTHDPSLLAEACRIIADRGIQDQTEIQFFAGANDPLALSLSRQNFRVRLYLIYGWLFKYYLSGFKTFDNKRNIQRLFRLKTIK